MKRPMNVESTFAWSITIIVSTASLILAFAEESKWPTALTPFIAIACHFLVDRWNFLRLSVWGANLLGMLAFMAMAVEFIGSDVLAKLISGAHLLVYMTWVVLLMPKGIRQYWWLLALSLLQVSVSSVLTTSGGFGVSLVLMLLLMVWTTSIFTLFRARQRLNRNNEVEDSLAATATAAKSPDSVLLVRDGLQLDSHEPWIGWRFRAIVAFTFVSSLLVAGITFAAFPRIWVPQSPLANFQDTEGGLVNQTGFTDEVALGEIGEIMQSDKRALAFEITRMNGGMPVTPEQFTTAAGMDELLLRGNALGKYESGRWTGTQQRVEARWAMPFATKPSDSDFRFRISQDPPIHNFALVPAPVSNAVNKGNGTLLQHPYSYAVEHRFSEAEELRRSQQVDYEVWVKTPNDRSNVHLPGGSRKAGEDRLSVALQLREAGYNQIAYITPNLPDLLPKLVKKTNELCRDETGELLPPAQRIRRVMFFLNTSGEFTYSHTLNIINPDIDPVEDFLLNQKKGHCEYFASAATLMLQSAGLPARVVNGYKGWDLNTVSGKYEVKQKYAHTWMEVFVDGRWETHDPTPSAPREEIVSKTSQMDWWNDLNMAMGDNWTELIEKMSLQRQEALVQPLISRVKEIWRIIKQQGLAAALKLFYQEVLLQPGKWISLQTGFVTFILLLIPGLLIKSNPFTKTLRALRSALPWLSANQNQQRTVIRFYDNFKNACRKRGLTFPDHQTAHENAISAVKHFQDCLTSEEDRLLAERIARSFNSVRFGNSKLTAESIASIRADVSRFGELISSASAKATV